jgi:hypothetical protein
VRGLTFVPYGKALKGVPNVFVDALRTPSTTLELSHWPGNRTPPELKGDVSTQAVLHFLELTEERQQELLSGAAAVSCDHYDVDGLLSLWCLVAPDLARRHADLVARTAVCGDFDLDTGPDAVQACLALLAAEREVQADMFAGRDVGSAEEATAGLFSEMLARTEQCLLAPESFRPAWDAEWEHLQWSRQELAERPELLTEHPALDLTVVHDRPERLHDYAVNAQAKGLHVLRLRPDNRHSLAFRYESFVDLQSRTPGPRVRGDLLTERLNVTESAGTWFCEPPSTATPLMQLYSAQVPAASSYSASELEHAVREFFEEAHANRELQWLRHEDWYRETPVGPPSKEVA